MRIRKALERAERLLGNAASDNLTKTEADIYRILASEHGKYFTVLEIFSAIRGEGYVGDEGNMRSHMSRLRSKLREILLSELVRRVRYKRLEDRVGRVEDDLAELREGVCAVLKQLFEPDTPPKRNKIGFDA